jgi:14-3-3 protein epsilon
MKGEEGDALHTAVLEQYKRVLEQEMEGIIGKTISQLQSELIPEVVESEAAVFYHKMVGDCNRYRSELKDDGPDKQTAVHNAIEAYQLASECAVKELPPLNAVRLGLALNFCVFLYEIAKDVKGALKVAKAAYEDAIVELDFGIDDSLSDSSWILKILGERLKKWDESGDSNSHVSGQSESLLDIEGM